MSQPVTGAVAPTGTPDANANDVTPKAPETQEPTSSTLSHEDALKELAKVRSEAAARRVANKELEEKAKKWAEYEESQKSELQKLQDSLAEKERKLAEKDQEVLREKIAREFNVSDEDLDLLVGDEASMKRLAAKLGKQTTDTGKPADLLAGNRGKPVGTSKDTFSMESFIRGL